MSNVRRFVGIAIAVGRSPKTFWANAPGAWPTSTLPTAVGSVLVGHAPGAFAQNVFGLRPTAIEIDDLDVTTGWAGVNDDAGNVATDVDNIEGAAGLNVDKLDGTANTTYGLMGKTLAAPLNAALLGPAPVVVVRYNMPSLTDVTAIVVRLGEDATNYNEWTCSVTGATAGEWEECYIPLSTAVVNPVGTGWDSTSIDYVALGASFGLENDTLANMIFDQLMIISGMLEAPTSVVNTVVRDAAGNDRALNVDANGDIGVTIEGENASVTIDAPVGTPANVQISDGTDTALVQADGDLQVECSNCSGSGVSHIDDAAFTVTMDDIAPTGLLFDDAATATVTEDNAGIARMSANRNAYVTIRDAAGNERGLDVDANGDIGVTVTSMPANATELPAAATLQDNTPNPSAPAVASFMHVWDSAGVDWDRATVADGGAGVATATTTRVIAADDSPDVTALEILDDIVQGNEAQVDVIVFPDNEPFNVAQIAGTPTSVGVGVTDPGTIRTSSNVAIAGVAWSSGLGPTGTGTGRVSANMAISGTAVIGGIGITGAGTLRTSSNLAFNGVAASTGTGPTGTGVLRVASADEAPDVLALQIIDNIVAGNEAQVDVVAPLPAGTNTIGSFRPMAANTGGSTPLSFISAGTTEDEHAVCTGACTLYTIMATNVAATAAFLKCENDTAANTDPGTDTPEFRFAIPGATTGAGFVGPLGPTGVDFSTALTCWIVTGAADSDVTEVAANDVMVFYGFEQ
jgi:hypothetical protein